MQIELTTKCNNNCIHCIRENEAIREFKKALNLNPRNAPARYNLALVYKKMGFFEEARIESGKVVNVLSDVKNRWIHSSL